MPLRTVKDFSSKVFWIRVYDFQIVILSRRNFLNFGFNIIVVVDWVKGRCIEIIDVSTRISFCLVS